MLWYSAVSCKVSQFFALFLGTTGLILINLWFLFMLLHSAANCKVSKFSHFFAFFWRTTGLHQTLIFVHAVAFCNQVLSFTIFLSFWHFSQELLVSSWSNFDFCLCCGILQSLAMFPNFLHFFAYFSGTTVLILIKLWFLFMLWHSAANCKVSKFSHFFAFFWRTTGLHQTLIFVHAVAFYRQLQSFTNFSVFAINLRNYWFDLDQTLIFIYAVTLCK